MNDMVTGGVAEMDAMLELMERVAGEWPSSLADVTSMLGAEACRRLTPNPRRVEYQLTVDHPVFDRGTYLEFDDGPRMWLEPRAGMAWARAALDPHVHQRLGPPNSMEPTSVNLPNGTVTVYWSYSWTLHAARVSLTYTPEEVFRRVFFMSADSSA